MRGDNITVEGGIENERNACFFLERAEKMMSFANPAPASRVNLAKPFDLSLSRDKATPPSGVVLLSWSVHQR